MHPLVSGLSTVAGDQSAHDRSKSGAARPPTRKGGLGRGLGALIPPAESSVGQATDAIREVPLASIQPNPYQPRASVQPDRLQELADSIRLHGVIQPLVVKRDDLPDRYVLIAGERRWRAARLAGLASVPVVIKDAAPRSMLELALVENVVRADLAPLEEAAAYRQLIDDFGLTQAEIAERVGRNRVTITNTLRLLAAPPPVQGALNVGQITEGHARALLGLPNAIDQVALLEIVIDKEYTVRQTEDAVRRWLTGGRTPEPLPAPRLDDARLEERFRGAFGTKVSLRRHRRGAGGTLTIHYFSDEELNQLYHRFVGEDDW
jgi:ParB family chromosome partitioning protein